MGVLQRAFPNSTLQLNDMVPTTDEVDILQLLNCTELRGFTVSAPLFTPGGRSAHFWRALATLGRLHGSRLQLDVPEPDASRMLEAEPALAAHVSQAELEWSENGGSGLADQVSRLSSLTRLTLPIQGSVPGEGSLLGGAGMLDALRQLSALQSLSCMGHVMKTLLVNSVTRSWSLLTKLTVSGALDWSLVEQQCPQLQALFMDRAGPLCLTALTSLSCAYWEPRDGFQCSRLVDLHVKLRANPSLLPRTMTSLSLHSTAWSEPSPSVVNVVDDHLRSPQSLVHMCFKSQLRNPSKIQTMLPASHPALGSVTSVELTIHPAAFRPHMDVQQFHYLACMFPQLQRVHIHLDCRHGRQPEKEVLVSAAWLPAHCRLVVTHQLTCRVRITKCPSGCLSLPLCSRPADEWQAWLA